MDKETARETWEALKQLFEATSKDQLFKLCTDLFAYSWTSGEDVSMHLAKLRSLWGELNNGLKIKGESELPDLLLVCKTLQILPNSFETFRSSWMLLTKDSEKTFDELNMQLGIFERNIRGDCSKDNQEALAVNTKFVRKYKSNPKEKDFCNYCKKRGHWVKRCFKWIADGKPPKDSGEKSNIVLIAEVNQACSVEPNQVDWWIDNGATKHITNRQDCFTSFEYFDANMSIQSAGSEVLAAVGKGSIEVVSKVGKEGKRFTLTDVWYVPNVVKNLFSVLAAQDKNRDSKFRSTPTKCTLIIGSSTV